MTAEDSGPEPHPFKQMAGTSLPYCAEDLGHDFCAKTVDDPIHDVPLVMVWRLPIDADEDLKSAPGSIIRDIVVDSLTALGKSGAYQKIDSKPRMTGKGAMRVAPVPVTIDPSEWVLTTYEQVGFGENYKTSLDSTSLYTRRAAVLSRAFMERSVFVRRGGHVT